MRRHREMCVAKQALVGATAQTSQNNVLEDDVVVHANASIVGRVTVGARSRVEGGVWLNRDVPADSVVEAARPIVRPAAAGTPA